MRLALTFVLLSSLIGCHGGHDVGTIDTTIGGACATDRDCDVRCFQDNNDHFPGGFCSLPCASDLDCPTDTACVDIQGGVCMFLCPAFNCGQLGAGWSCHDHDHVGGGKSNVCSG
jgi:hypothetical protein